MFNLILENKNGDQLTFSQTGAFTVTDIQGLNPPDATINTSEVALIDGAKFNSAKLNMRTINVAFAIQYGAAYNRIEVYKVLKSKQYVKLYYDGDYRQVWIEGYIQSIDIDYFAMKQIVTCTIVCPSPYFKEAQAIVNAIQNIINAFHFPFASTADPQLVMGYYSKDVGVTVENDGDVECGLIITLYARQYLRDPKIFDYISGQYFGVSWEMTATDQIVIDTRQGHKTVTLIRNGVKTNIFNRIMQGSTWLQLPVNGSTYTYEVGEGYSTSNLSVTFTHENLYEGV